MSIAQGKFSASFDLLYLDYTEHLFSDICSFANFENKTSKGKLRVTNNSLIFEDFNLNQPLVKYVYDDQFSIKTLSCEEINLIYNDITKANFIIKECKDTFTLKYRRKKRSSEKKSSIFMFSPIKTKKSEPKLPKPISVNNIDISIPHKKNSLRFSPSTKSIPSLKQKNSKNDNFDTEIFNFFGSSEKKENNSSMLTVNDVSSFELSPKRRQSPINSIVNLNNVHSQLNFLKKNFSSLQFAHLSSYLSNKNLSPTALISILHKANESNSHKNYSLIYLTYQRVKYFNRINFCFSEFNLEIPQNALFIIEGNNDSRDVFLNDIFEFTEAQMTHKEEDQDGIVSIITSRKIEELKSTMKFICYNKDDIYDLTANFASEASPEKSVLLFANAMRILPSKYQIGLFIIKTDNTCEFIPVNNSIDNTQVIFSLDDIRCVIPYRFLYQYKAANIILYKNVNSTGNKDRSILLDFTSKEDYVNIYEYLLENCKNIDISYTDINYHTNLWVDGLISNYDYLIYLNEMSGRSCNDVSQYPIFPWILSNYKTEKLDLYDINNYRDLSKPIGLLKSGLNRIISDDDSYIFRNYYSFPFVIFYYLMRSNPLFYLRYQGWNFGPPDRMLNSIDACFDLTYVNKAALNDCKELIPEFYSEDMSFLVNIHNINFGTTQNGEKIGNVALPKWAKSRTDFAHIMRSALESEIVSNNIHKWFDLIFGVNQKGNEEIGNLFYKMRYESSIGEIMGKSEEDKRCCLDDVLECGQVPIRIFNAPHPKKRSQFGLREMMLITQNSKVDEVFAQRKKRLNIEVKYEKERRDKEIQTDKIKNIFREKEKIYLKQIEELQDNLKIKENEFKSNVSAIKLINVNLQNTFKEYNANKEKVFNDIIKKMNEEYKENINEKLNDKKDLKKNLSQIEKLMKKYTNRKISFENVINELNKKLNEYNEENEKIKKSISEKIRFLKSLPLNIQASVDGIAK